MAKEESRMEGQRGSALGIRGKARSQSGWPIMGPQAGRVTRTGSQAVEDRLMGDSNTRLDPAFMGSR
jgi:hypothetical protein